MPRKLEAIILALESSADETSAAIFRGDRETGKGRLLSNVIYSQIAQHRKTGGIVPEVAARAHLPKIIPATKLALKKANIELKNINAVAVTVGPGLVTSLMIGVDTAKTLAFALSKPIIPINHLEGHLLSGFAENFKKPFPALGLVVSGGHTMLVLIKSIGQYKIIGETLDDAAGECFDKIAKLLGLPYPGGPELSRLAEKGKPQAMDLPRPMLNKNNYNFSFSGLKTAVLYSLRDNPKTKPADVAAATEQAIVDVLVAKTLRAAREYKVKTVLLGGGVAANKKLRATLRRELKKNIPHALFFTPHSSLTGDNAGMIAATAWRHYRAGHATTFDKVNADPNLQLKNWR